MVYIALLYTAAASVVAILAYFLYTGYQHRSKMNALRIQGIVSSYCKISSAGKKIAKGGFYFPTNPNMRVNDNILHSQCQTDGAGGPDI